MCPRSAAGLVATRRRHRPPAHSRGDRSRQHSSRPHRPAAPPLHSSKTSPASAARSAAKSTWAPPCATGSSTCWTSGGQIGDGTCSSACARSGACALGCSTGPEHPVPLETQRTSSSATRQEDFAVTRRHDTAQRAHHAGVRRPLPQRGDDHELGARTFDTEGHDVRPSEWWVSCCVACT